MSSVSVPSLEAKPLNSIEGSPTLCQEVCVAIFAYNEQATIALSIDSVLRAAEVALPKEKVQVVVLVNGCTDQTAARVIAYEAQDPRVKLKLIDIGDKANAWNTYVHEVADLTNDNRLHVFMDGDVTCTPDALKAMLHSVLRSPHADAVATLPAPGVGRNRQLNMRLYEQDGAIFGNLYGLTTAFLCRVRLRNIRLPRGAIGEDAIVTEMVALNLDRQRPYDNGRTACAADPAGFVYRRLSPFRLADIRLYINRRIRYAIRDYQVPMLRSRAFEEMPETMEAIDREILSSLEGRFLLSPWQWLARRRLRRMLK